MKDTGKSACALFVLACVRDVEPTVFEREEWFPSECSEVRPLMASAVKNKHVLPCVSVSVGM